MRELLAIALGGEPLTREQAREAMRTIMRGAATPAQVGALLGALAARGETAAEVGGFAEAMLELAVRVEPGATGTLDTCGTGGDGADTFNISTTSAFVVAAAGVPVAKHGNRSVSSACGSADVLEALGVVVDLPAAAAARCIDAIGVGFLFAPRFHPAMRHAAPTRRELGVRTVFNLLGPLVNPARTPFQLVGVYTAAATRLLAEAFLLLGSRSALVVHGDGLDELSLAGPTRGHWARDGRVEAVELTPEDAGLPRAPHAALAGGDRGRNAALVRAVLGGTETGARRDAVLLNAGAALVVAGAAAGLGDGVELARRQIDSGAALERLEALVATSRRLAAEG